MRASLKFNTCEKRSFWRLAYFLINIICFEFEKKLTVNPSLLLLSNFIILLWPWIIITFHWSFFCDCGQLLHFYIVVFDHTKFDWVIYTYLYMGLIGVNTFYYDLYIKLIKSFNFYFNKKRYFKKKIDFVCYSKLK